MNVYIYALIDPEDNQIRYIGKTDDVKKRLRKHLSNHEMISDTYKNRWLRKLLNKNLKPDTRVVEECPQEIWQERERYWIKYYKGAGCKLTNATDGGEGGEISLETRKKLSDALKGRVFSDEHKAKIANNSSKMRGLRHTEESKKKMSETRKGILVGDKNPMWGRKWTDEQRESFRKKFNKKSSFAGVFWRKDNEKWRVGVYNKKMIWVGNFSDEIEAAKAYDYYVLSHNIPSKLNFGCDI